ncbi:MAG TPA: MarR family transcriptional regulator [Rhizobiales bacterium]|nr:MarR family transcriptional regulator [Hyphomicrobiales bacterium]
MTPPEPPRSVRLPSELGKLDRSMAHLLHRAQQLATEVFREEMGRIGLTRPQFSFLLTISRQPGLGQKELAAQMGADTSTIAEIASRMEACGYITREPRPGSPRGVCLHLSPAGKRRLKRARRAAASTDRFLLHLFPAKDRRAILTGLMRLSEEIERREKERRTQEKSKPGKPGVAKRR